MSAVISKAFSWFTAGLKEADLGHAAWKQTRSHIITAGFYFQKARELIPHGEWGQFLNSNADKIRPRTVRLYIELAEAAVAWVQSESPKIAGTELQRVAAEEVMLMSPKPLVALLRDLREMRPFGEYDAVRYAASKRGLPRQVEFDFVSVSSQIEMLTHLTEPNYSLRVPEGTSQSDALRELETKLESALGAVRSQLNTITV